MTDNEQVEICWNFPISKDKFRIRCLVKVLNAAKSDIKEKEKELLNKIWNQQDDDSKMRYRGAISGQVKDMKASNLVKDELNSYEP